MVQVDYGQRKGEWEWLPTAASLAKLAKLAVAEVDVPGSGDGGTAGGAADGRETAREAAERRTKIPRAPTPTQREYCQQVRQAPPVTPRSCNPPLMKGRGVVPPLGCMRHLR